MGITRREQQILDRLDRGLPHRAIAKELGLSKSYVYQVAVNLNPGIDGDRRREQAIRTGTRSLLAALVVAGYPTPPRPEHRR